MTNTLAIIAAGAMGSAIARRVAQNGARVLTSLKERSQATVEESFPVSVRGRRQHGPWKEMLLRYVKYWP
jgi:3-hydroxyacyl-CoA dehydrogenase